MLNYSAITNELKNQQQWCCWKTLLRDNKPTKIPIDAKTGKNAESNNPTTWCNFEQAVEFYQEKLKSQYEDGKAGIGFFLSENDPYSFIDIDNCIVNGNPNQETQSVIKKFHSYTDVSPSNSGIHIIVKAEKPGDKCRTGKVDWCSHVEIYDKLRYFTFTGNILNGHNTIGSRQKELSEFYNELFPKVIPFKKSESSKTVSTKGNCNSNGNPKSTVFTKKNWDDQTLIQTAFNAGNGNKFKNLWSGNWVAEGYPSQSEADLAFCEILVFWTQGDRARTDNLFRQSGLFREKWNRDDYRKRTLDKALGKITEYYKPKRNWTHSPQSQPATDESTVNSHPKPEEKQKKPIEESDSKPEFYPTPIAKRLLAQNDFIWQFVTEQDQFYQYGDGVWSQIDEGYLEKAIRNILFDYSPDWDNKHKRTEVIAALKDHLIDPAIVSRFNPGINPNLELINVKNGMLNWGTGEILQHSKDYYSTCQLNVEYNPEAQSELWEQSLKQWIPEKRSRMFVQEFSGYCLIPDTSQHRSVILVGAGSNGKSTFLYAIEQLFGEDNLSSIPMKKLPARFELARIQHKLVNICADIESGYIEQTSDIKKIISGDTLRGELKYKSSFDFTPITRLWFSCNEIPKASDRSEAWYRRFEFITFPNRFEGSKKTLS